MASAPDSSRGGVTIPFSGRIHGAMSLGWQSPWSLVVVAMLFVIIGMSHLDLPGPYPDEVIQAAPAAALSVGLIPSSPINGIAIDGDAVVINHLAYPFVMLTYLGPVKTYVLAFAFWLFGASVEVTRVTTLSFGFLGVCFTYLFARLVGGPVAANVATVLLGSDPSYLLSARDDWGPIIIGFALKMLGLYFVALWWRKPRSLAGPIFAGLCFGLGLSHKADFAWFLLAAAPVGFVLFQLHRRLFSWRGALALLGFLGGALPLLFFNLSTNWSTWTSAGSSLSDGLGPFLSSGSILSGLLAYFGPFADHHWSTLLTVLDGQSIVGFIVGLSRPDIWNQLTRLKLDSEFILFGTAVILSVILFLGRTGTSYLRFVGALVATILGILIQILVTPSAGGPHHLIAIYPFPQLTIAVGASAVAPFAAQNTVSIAGVARRWVANWHLTGAGRLGLTWVRALLTLPLAIVVVANVYQLVYFRTNLVTTGGNLYWSDAIERAAIYLEQSPPGDYDQTLDWGLRDQLVMLLGPRHPVGFWGPGTSAQAEFDYQLAHGYRLFVLHAESATLFKTDRSRFLDVIADPRIGWVNQTSFNDRSGNPIVSVIKVQPVSRASLLNDLATAAITPWAGNSPAIGVHSIVVDGNSYQVLLQHPTSSVTFHLTIPPTASQLVFAPAIDPTCWSVSDGASFNITVADGSTVASVYSARKDPKNVPTDRRWADVAIDLNRWSGRSIDLTLATGPGTSGYTCSWAEWGEPEIISRIASQ